MFNTQAQVYTIYKPIEELDNYNQKIITWEEVGTERIFISLNSHQKPATDNAVFAQQCEWIGVGSSISSIDVGWKIGDYEVVFVVNAGRQNFYYLKNYGR